MAPNSDSSSSHDLNSAASPVELEIQAVRNCVGRVYKFKPQKKWSSDIQHEVHRDRMYQQHPVVVIHKQSDGHVHIVNITSSIDEKIDSRMYIPVSGNHWDISDTRSKLNLASTETGACEMPKPQSYVRLDSRTQVPLDVLQEYHSHSGQHYQLSSESVIKLWDSVMEAERGFATQQELEYQDAERKVSLAVSGYINRWTSVQQGECQIGTLRLLQKKVIALAGAVDECLEQHWLRPQQELERSLSEQERTLQNAVSEQLDCQIQNQGPHNLFLKEVEAEVVKRVETEFTISEMRDLSIKGGKRTRARNKRLKTAVEKLVREEIQRTQSEGKI